MEGSKIFPNDIFRDKYDHQGFIVVMGCEFCTLYGGKRVCMILKEGKCVPLYYIQIGCTQK